MQMKKETISFKGQSAYQKRWRARRLNAAHGPPTESRSCCNGNAEDANVLDLLVPLRDRVCGLMR
jgi:hypothetical protein